MKSRSVSNSCTDCQKEGVYEVYEHDGAHHAYCGKHPATKGSPSYPRQVAKGLKLEDMIINPESSKNLEITIKKLIDAGELPEPVPKVE